MIPRHLLSLTVATAAGLFCSNLHAAPAASTLREAYADDFLIGAALTCSIEYLTSILLEKLFHAKWWDYSDHRFNFQGRVCLLGAVAFGSAVILSASRKLKLAARCRFDSNWGHRWATSM